MKSLAKGRLTAYLAQLQARRSAANAQNGGAPPAPPSAGELAAAASPPAEAQQQHQEQQDVGSHSQQQHASTAQVEQQDVAGAAAPEQQHAPSEQQDQQQQAIASAPPEEQQQQEKQQIDAAPQPEQQQGDKELPAPQAQGDQSAAAPLPEVHAPPAAPQQHQQHEQAALQQSTQAEQQHREQVVQQQSAQAEQQQDQQQHQQLQDQEQQQQQQEPGSTEAVLPAAAVAAAAVAPSVLNDIIDLTADDEGGDGRGAAAGEASPADAAAAAAAAADGGAATAGWSGLLRRALHNASEFVRLVVQGTGQALLQTEDLRVLQAAAQRSRDPAEQQAAAAAIHGVGRAAQAIRAWQHQQQLLRQNPQYAAALQQQYAAALQQQQYAAALQQQQQQQQWGGATITTGVAGTPGAQQQQPQLGYSLAGFGLAQRGIVPAGAAGPSSATVVSGAGAPLLAANRVDKEQAVRAALEGLETAGSGSEERQPPEGLLLTPLLRHQRIALAWMCRRESAGQQPMGGILADDQGLGKTVSTISLIVTNRPSAKQQGQLARLAGSSTSLAASASQQQARKRRRGASADGAAAAASGATLGSSSSGSRGDGGGGSSSDEYPTSSSDEEVEGVGNSGGGRKRRASAAPSSSGDVVCLDSEGEEEAEEAGLAGGTLVVCPTTVLHQWAAEIRAKVNPNAGVTVHVYHGKGKAVSAGTLSRFGVVLTTFQTMALEAPKRDAAAAPASGKKAGGGGGGAPLAASASAAAAAAAAAGVAFDDDFIDLLSDSEEAGEAAAGKRHKGPSGARSGGGSGEGGRGRPGGGGGPLYEVMWHRVVLDEAQCIKNPRTLAAHAAWSLKARSRWCLSGTPLQNTLDDLYSYFRFLRYEPYCRKERFNEMLRDPIAAGGAQGQRGLQRLHTVLKGVMLRRTKQSQLDGKPIIDLPPRKQQLLRAKLSPAEREFYERLKTEASAEFRRLQQQNGGVGQHYVGVLWQLLRLRQACNHPLLVKGAGGLAPQQPVPAAELAAARKLVPHLRAHLAGLLSPQRLEPCAVCGDMPEDAVAAVCGHVFCAQCVATQLSNAGHGAAEAELAFHCPTCRQALGKHDTFTAAALEAAAAPAAAAQQQEQQVQEQQDVRQQDVKQEQQQQQQQQRALEAGHLPGVAAQQPPAGTGIAVAAAGSSAAAGAAGVASPAKWQSSAKLDALMDMLCKLRDKGAAAEAEAKAQRSVLTSGRSLSHARLAAALGGGAAAAAAARKPSRGAGTGGRSGGAAGAGASRGASPRLPMEKVIVFSQWTAMLDLAEAPLRREGFQFRRLDGTMNIKARQQAIEDFSRRPEVAVMLVSLKAASLGVNLVSANHVVLMDLWYNPTVEEQAIDRAHRIGQTRPVHVTRITIEDSIEDQILKLQDRKRATIAQALQEGSGAGGLAAFSSRLTQQELHELFDDVARAR